MVVVVDASVAYLEVVVVIVVVVVVVAQDLVVVAGLEAWTVPFVAHLDLHSILLVLRLADSLQLCSIKT